MDDETIEYTVSSIELTREAIDKVKSLVDDLETIYAMRRFINSAATITVMELSFYNTISILKDFVDFDQSKSGLVKQVTLTKSDTFRASLVVKYCDAMLKNPSPFQDLSDLNHQMLQIMYSVYDELHGVHIADVSRLDRVLSRTARMKTQLATKAKSGPDFIKELVGVKPSDFSLFTDSAKKRLAKYSYLANPLVNMAIGWMVIACYVWFVLKTIAKHPLKIIVLLMVVIVAMVLHNEGYVNLGLNQ